MPKTFSTVKSESKYQNPVYGRSFPDPFILRHNGMYFAFCTGLAPDGRCFGRLRSDDLVNWTELPGAMLPLSTGQPNYWAPEATYYNGKFYLYYSVGNETLMTIRVAVSDTADGDFVDAGMELTREDFAIDPHVFRNADGRFYMFYATDFLDHSHIGTGTVIDEMIDPLTLKGNPRPVTRPGFDWQLYDPSRKEKNGVRWHTVEGPFVLERKGSYYQMFSGGNWQDPSYGVSFAVTDDLECDREWTQYSDGITTLPILSTLADRVIGPGHNSVTLGPNNRELFCVYHRWQGGERVLAIDRMDFAGDRRLFVVGPSYEPQPSPYKPHLRDDFSTLDPRRWSLQQGEWQAKEMQLLSGDGPAEIVCNPEATSFTCSFYSRLLNHDTGSAAGFVVTTQDGNDARYMFLMEGNRSFVRWSSNSSSQDFDLPIGTDLSGLAEMTTEIDNRSVKIRFDGMEFHNPKELASPVKQIGLCSHGAGAAFSAFTVTHGFRDLFETADLAARGWKVNEEAYFEIKGGLLIASALGEQAAVLSRSLPSGDFDLALNMKFDDHRERTSYLVVDCSNSFVLSYVGPHWQLRTKHECFRFPSSFAPDVSHQLRFVAQDRRTAIYLDAELLGSVDCLETEDLTITVNEGVAYFDMIRYAII